MYLQGIKKSIHGTSLSSAPKSTESEADIVKGMPVFSWQYSM
jgi:hypothetical protein